MSVDRLNEYRTIRLLFEASWSSTRVENRASRRGAGAAVFKICVCREIAGPGLDGRHSGFDILPMRTTRLCSLRIGPPTEPPNCSRSKGGVGRSRSKVAGSPCRWRLRSSSWRLVLRLTHYDAGTATRCYFAAAAGSILSMTMAREPPRTNTLPVTVTLSAANGSSFSFCPMAGIASEMGQ